MSRATGYVLFSDNTLKYFEYDGTTDWCYSKLYNTYKERVDNWRNNNNYSKCNCNSSEPVEIASDYGGGFHWKGIACKKCMALTEGIDLQDLETEDGLPFWAKRDNAE